MSRAAVEKLANGDYKFFGSRFGGCLHGQELNLLGAKQDAPRDAQQDLFDDGHQAEADAKEALQVAGFDIRFASSKLNQQHSVSIEKQYSNYKIELTSHLDGLLVAPGDWKVANYIVHPLKLSADAFFVFEHKSVTPDVLTLLASLSEEEFLSHFLKHYKHYAWQVSAQYWGMLRQLWEEHCELHPEDDKLEALKEIWNHLRIMVSFSERLKDERELEDKTPLEQPRRVAFVLDKAPFTKNECLNRCNEVVQNYLVGKISECDSPWPCGYHKARIAYRNRILERGDQINAEQRYLQRQAELDKMSLPKRKRDQ